MPSTQASTLLSKIDSKTLDAIRLHNKDAWEISRTSPQEGLEKAKKALALSLENDFDEGVAIAKSNITACQLWLGKYAEALEVGMEAIKELKALAIQDRLAETQYSIAVVYYFLGDYEKQLKYCFTSLGVAEGVDYKSGIANALNGIGTVFYSNGEPSKGLEYLERGLKICEETGNEQVKMRILDGLGESHYQLGSYTTALEFKNKALGTARKLNIKQVESYALDGIGTIYLALGDLEKSAEHYKSAIAIRKEMGFVAGEAQSLMHLGKAYLKYNQFIQAEQLLNEALVKAEKINAIETIFKAHEALAELYEKNGNLSLFAKHVKEFHKYQLDHSTERNSQLIQSAELEAQMSRMSQEKALLLSQKEQLDRYMSDVKVLEDIGKELISSLDLEDILNTVYEKVNSIMDASVFAIGLYNPLADTIDMHLAIEKGVRMPSVSLSMKKDKTRIGVWVAINKKEAILNDVANEIQQYVGKVEIKAYVGEMPESIIYLPLLAQDNLIGILTVQSFEKNAYTDYQVGLLRNLAIYASSAIQNANLYKNLEDKVEDRTTEVRLQKEEIERNQRSTQLLSEIGQQLISTLDIETVFESLHRNVNELMDASCFGIRLYDPEQNCVHYKYEIENGGRQEDVSVSMDKRNNYSVWCILNKQPIHLNDNASEHSKYVDEIMVVSGDMPHSLLFQPLMKGEEVLGVITVQSFEKYAYTEHHLYILKTLASYTVIAIENARLYERMEQQVQKRTLDLTRISKLGQNITQQLSVEGINKVLYEGLNEMMDAPSFGIGIYNKEDNSISFPGYIEEGKLLSGSYFKLTETDRMAVACFIKELEILIGDFQVEHGKYITFNPKPKAGRAVTSLIYLPLWVKGEKIGVITVQSFNKHTFSEYHLNILKGLATYVATAIENARLYQGLEDLVEDRTREVIKQKEEVERSYQNTELLSRIGRDITSSLSIPDIIARVYENINRLMQADCFGVGIYEQEHHRILMPGFYEMGSQMADFHYDCSDPNRLAVICFMNEKEIIINDYFTEYSKYIKGLQQPVSGTDSSSIIYVPVYSKDKMMGVITVQSFTAHVYTDYHVNLVRNLAVYVGIALENATLYLNLEEKVKERTKEVIEQKEIIEEKNKSITDSIKYAKRIQDATLPEESRMQKVFADSFVLFKPKDIVSGDFYWMEHLVDVQDGEKFLFAVVDCTGHGVPGAFMSLIGHNALNQIVKEYHITKPDIILKKLDEIVNSTLKSSGDDHALKVRDGMDIALCSYQPDKKLLEFAGAFNPLYLIRHNDIIEIKGDKISIGENNAAQYQNHQIQLEKDDMLYIFSDGYADQFGGPSGKKMKYSRFRDFLLENINQPCTVQKDFLNSHLELWRGNIEQIDDICVIGVRV